MSKEIKIAGSISFGGKRLNVYGDLDAPLFKAKILVMLSATAAVTSGECSKCARKMKS